jgi:hypothetical protein
MPDQVRHDAFAYLIAGIIAISGWALFTIHNAATVGMIVVEAISITADGASRRSSQMRLSHIAMK